MEDFFARPYLIVCCVPGSMFYFPAVFLRPNNRLDTNANSRARAAHERYCLFMFRRMREEKGVAILMSLHDSKMRGAYNNNNNCSWVVARWQWLFLFCSESQPDVEDDDDGDDDDPTGPKHVTV